MQAFDFFADLVNPQLGFLPRALVAAVLSAAVCAVVGCHVVLRGTAFIGDAVSHAVFPGVAVAFVLGGNVLVGGAVAGVVSALLITLLGRGRLLKEDSAIGVVFVAAFAVGLIVISRSPGYTGSLESFLFGSIAAVSGEEIPVLAGLGALLVGVCLLLTRSFLAVTLDRESARALGLPVLALDAALNVLVTLAIVLSLHIVGNVLVVALLIAPAASARLLTDQMGRMLLLAPVIGAVEAFAGLWAAWTLDLPVGATVVLACTAGFLLARLAAPRHGLWRRLLPRGSRPAGEDGASGPPPRELSAPAASR